jgi:hypothetical protein
MAKFKITFENMNVGHSNLARTATTIQMDRDSEAEKIIEADHFFMDKGYIFFQKVTVPSSPYSAAYKNFNVRSVERVDE